MAAIPATDKDFSLEKLEEIELKVVDVLQSAGHVLEEMSKDKVNEKVVDQHTHKFNQSLSSIEQQLTNQINYLIKVATNHQHEGSSYANRYKLEVERETCGHIARTLDAIVRTHSTPQQQQQQQGPMNQK